MLFRSSQPTRPLLGSSTSAVPRLVWSGPDVTRDIRQALAWLSPFIKSLTRSGCSSHPCSTRMSALGWAEVVGWANAIPTSPVNRLCCAAKEGRPSCQTRRLHSHCACDARRQGPTSSFSTRGPGRRRMCVRTDTVQSVPGDAAAAKTHAILNGASGKDVALVSKKKRDLGSGPLHPYEPPSGGA
jgi:hypothetical protein